jgi:hypothetical protein
MPKAPKKLKHPKDPPSKQVLLLTCMDLRLTDDTTHFMNEFNLENRYDHLCFAGAAMGARTLKSPLMGPEPKLSWKSVFFDHLYGAIELLHREIKDIFIIEHLDCGAYKELHLDVDLRKEYEKRCKSGMESVIEFHRHEAYAFAQDILDFCALQRKACKTKAKEAESAFRCKKEHSLADCKIIVDADRKAAAWEGINVRCFIMDLKGHVEAL